MCARKVKGYELLSLVHIFSRVVRSVETPRYNPRPRKSIAAPPKASSASDAP